MKSFICIVAIGLFFSVSQGVWGETIEACVNKSNGNTRILAPNSNSEECRNSENPVSWSQGSNGNGNIIVSSNPVPYERFCDTEENSFAIANVQCPENTVLIGSSCNVDKEIPDTGFKDIELIRTVANEVINFDPFTQIPERISCTLNCLNVLPDSELSGNLTAKALCAEI